MEYPITTATLYIIATPIGNLGDITARAIEILRQVDLIAAEDTRHSRPLLQHFNINTKLIAYHDHNEASQAEHLIARLQQGESIALISDAGTPLISDPGYTFVRQARAAGINIEPIPGACALIAALSASGLPTDKFFFAGFLPPKAAAREKALQTWQDLPATLVFYESPRRVLDCLTSIQTVFPQSECVIGREITKKFATFYQGTPSEVQAQLVAHPEQQKGEFVVMVHNVVKKDQSDLDAATQKILLTLADELPTKQAAKLAAAITGIKKNRLYDWLVSSS